MSWHQAGLDHKFVIILNKARSSLGELWQGGGVCLIQQQRRGSQQVDQLDSSVDFARAYGTLGWALSKVVWALGLRPFESFTSSPDWPTR